MAGHTKIGPMLGRFRPTWGPTSAQTYPCRPDVGRFRPNLANSTGCGPTPTRRGRFDLSCRLPPSVGRIRPILDRCLKTWHILTKLGPTSSRFGPSSTNVERHRPSLGRHRPNLRQVWPTFHRVWAGVGPNSANSGPMSTKFGPMLTEFRLGLAEFGPGSTQKEWSAEHCVLLWQRTHCAWRGRGRSDSAMKGCCSRLWAGPRTVRMRSPLCPQPSRKQSRPATPTLNDSGGIGPSWSMSP